jgi:hypothetical protein
MEGSVVTATAGGLQPLHHHPPDPNVCPSCGAEESIRELGKRYTWQPLTLCYDAEGQLADDEYREFDYADDVEVTGFECGECMEQWETLAGLAAAQRFRHALEDHAEFWELRADRLQALVDGSRTHPREALERAAAEGRAQAFRHALAILHGNGEA